MMESVQTPEAMIRQYEAEIQRIKQAYRERNSTGGMVDRVLVGLALFGPDHRLVRSVQTDHPEDAIGRISSVRNLGEKTLTFYTDDQVQPEGTIRSIGNEAILRMLRGRVESTLREGFEETDHTDGLIVHCEDSTDAD